MGRRIGVTVSLKEPPALVAAVNGKLKSGSDVSRVTEGEAFAFAVTGGDFIVEERTFRGAGQVGIDGDDSLSIDLGAVAIQIDPED
jgi:hypothetical protein